jgi:hypothetical protein
MMNKIDALISWKNIEVFLHMNGIKDGIMRKDTSTAKPKQIEIERNRQISKKRYIVEQY